MLKKDLRRACLLFTGDDMYGYILPTLNVSPTQKEETVICDRCHHTWIEVVMLHGIIAGYAKHYDCCDKCMNEHDKKTLGIMNPPALPAPSTLFQEEEKSGEMTEDELANHFNVPVPSKKEEPKFREMTLEQIEDWESKQDNNNSIYKVAARVKNAATAAAKGNLTSQGVILCNMFTHLFKNLYDFAETIPDKETKIKLIEVVRKSEDIPANLIEALAAGVR